jgi:hypothetical protein
MRTPPLEWEDAIALGMDATAVVTWNGVAYTVDPPLPRLLSQLFRELAARPAMEGDRLAYLRHVRDLLIGLTDWTQAADSPLKQEQRTAWAAYRQALRDLPSAWDGESAIPWPQVP